MARARSFALKVFLVMGFFACGGDDDDASSADAAASDAGSAPDAALAVSTHMLVSLVADDETATLALLMVHPDGTLEEIGDRLPVEKRVRAIALRADGREALAVFGLGVADAKGVHVVSIDPDRAAMSIVDTVDLVMQNSPTGIVYNGDDEAILGTYGPEDNTLVALRREGDGWEAGPSVICCESPYRLYDIGEVGRALLLRSSAIDDPGSDALPIARREDGGWEVEGEGFSFGTERLIEIAMSPDKDLAFGTVGVPTADPLNPASELVVIELDRTTHEWSQRGEVTPLAAYGSQIAMSREGDVAVMVDSVMIIDPETDTPKISHYEIQTIDVSPDGDATETPGVRTRITDASLIEVLAFGPGGVLVAPDSKGDAHHFRTYRREGPASVAWNETDSLELGGYVYTLAIAPP